ncbi:MAG: class I SAM-dependent methyltransferase [Candidatus Dormibacteraeota bacterium]|uniref:Class I SAM-dependent methyltransferase n=2 Tax=Candidatus Dormiibacter inghamiae TaxID=3127013 RepID=A0A934N6A0_9BACT|nr:class I SAM-dependent methyltransferase [Candidatus Dormibacteraeota bacterium]MBJ7604878.1 class I SAM-dependent methyltransferase [Candidatus Dormibacteraeota bacterium]
MAPRYDNGMAFVERILFAGGREWVCAQAEGRVLEIAVGTGRNLPFYPPNVCVIGIEFSPAMLEIGRRRGAELGIEVDLREGDAQALDFHDESFDTVVITLALCSIPDDRKTVVEAWRVLRPGGRLLLLEHVRSPLLAVRWLQRIVDFFTVRFEGDHLLREPLEQLRVAGFVVDRLQRSKLGIVERVAARKPSL